MAGSTKREQIIRALEELLAHNTINNISVLDIAKKAGIGKGSIYYYFSSKDEILQALVERNYTQSITTAKELASNETIPPFTRMAMIFQACRDTSLVFTNQTGAVQDPSPERAFFHQKYIRYLVQELKPALTAIIEQGIRNGEIHFEDAGSLAEIVLIVLTVTMDNTIFPSSQEDILRILQALVALLEKGTENPIGSLNFLVS